MQVKILCAVKSTSIPIYVPGVQRVATPANGHRLRCGCRREDAKKRRHPCRSAIPGAFPLDLIGFHVYTFLAGGGWSSCPFSTRLRVLKLEQPSEVPSFCHSLTTLRVKSHLRLALLLLVVLVEAAPGFATQAILLHHLLQESGWLIRRVAALLVAHLHHFIHDIDAAEIRQLEWSHRMIQAQLERLVDILVGGDAFRVQVQRR